MKFAKFLRTPFLQNTSVAFFWKGMCVYVCVCTCVCVCVCVCVCACVFILFRLLASCDCKTSLKYLRCSGQQSFVESISRGFFQVASSLFMNLSYFKGIDLVKLLHCCHFNIFQINRRCFFRKMPTEKNNE